ncbi:general secretion pathway protein GspB [Lysobacter sp. 2RAF19]
MSLILEALRKSEAERRRAVVPDLLAEPALAAPIAKASSQRWPWIAGGLAIAASLAWFAMRDRAPAPISVIPARDARAVAQPAPATAAPIDTQRAAPALQRPIVVAPPAPPAPAKPAPVADAPPPVIAPPPRIERTPAPAPAPVAIDTTERVSDLGVEERKQLPPLKLSMHMWNDVASQRFVIIDGTRLRVGDRLGALVVADILPDGVLLDWNGRALKLPLQ